MSIKRLFTWVVCLGLILVSATTAVASVKDHLVDNGTASGWVDGYHDFTDDWLGCNGSYYLWNRIYFTDARHTGITIGQQRMRATNVVGEVWTGTAELASEGRSWRTQTGTSMKMTPDRDYTLNWDIRVSFRNASDSARLFQYTHRGGPGSEGSFCASRSADIIGVRSDWNVLHTEAAQGQQTSTTVFDSGNSLFAPINLAYLPQGITEAATTKTLTGGYYASYLTQHSLLEVFYDEAFVPWVGVEPLDSATQTDHNVQLFRGFDADGMEYWVGIKPVSGAWVTVVTRLPLQEVQLILEGLGHESETL